MSNSKPSGGETPYNPYAVDNEIDASDQSVPQSQHQSGQAIRVIGWIILLILSPVFAATAFFFTCLGTIGLGSFFNLVPIAAGILTLIATCFLAIKGLISTFKTKK